jgi:hypothetical protein
MELHKAFYRLGVAHAEGVLAGAHVWRACARPTPFEAFVRSVGFVKESQI